MLGKMRLNREGRRRKEERDKRGEGREERRRNEEKGGEEKRGEIREERGGEESRIRIRSGIRDARKQINSSTIYFDIYCQSYIFCMLIY